MQRQIKKKWWIIIWCTRLEKNNCSRFRLLDIFWLQNKSIYNIATETMYAKEMSLILSFKGKHECFIKFSFTFLKTSLPNWPHKSNFVYVVAKIINFLIICIYNVNRRIIFIGKLKFIEIYFINEKICMGFLLF